jgi:hypothetical protein
MKYVSEMRPKGIVVRTRDNLSLLGGGIVKA